MGGMGQGPPSQGRGITPPGAAAAGGVKAPPMGGPPMGGPPAAGGISAPPPPAAADPSPRTNTFESGPPGGGAGPFGPGSGVKPTAQLINAPPRAMTPQNAQSGISAPPPAGNPGAPPRAPNSGITPPPGNGITPPAAGPGLGLNLNGAAVPSVAGLNLASPANSQVPQSPFRKGPGGASPMGSQIGQGSGLKMHGSMGSSASGGRGIGGRGDLPN